MKDIKHRINFIEVFIVLLNISMFHTILPALLFGNLTWYYHQTFIILINIGYIIWNIKRHYYIKLKHNKIVYILILILSFIYFLELPRYLIGGLGGRNIFLTILNAVTFFSFITVLNTIYVKIKNRSNKIEALNSLIKPYFYFCLFIASISVSIFFLGKLNIIDLFNYSAPSGLSNYMDNNAETLNTRYYTPLYLTIISSGARGSNFFMDLALFSGISHEPHIATYLMTPAFLMMYGIKYLSTIKKIIYSVTFILFFLIASSLTNLITLMAIGIVYLIKLSIVNKKILNVLLITIIGIVILLTISIQALGIDRLLLKIGSSGGSLDYSLNFINYVLSPSSIWGDGVFNVPYPYANVDNIGLIFSMLIISFYIFGYLGSVQAIFQKNEVLQFVGLGALYFFLHSLKIIQLIFIYPFTIYIIFILAKSYEVKKSYRI